MYRTPRVVAAVVCLAVSGLGCSRPPDNEAKASPDTTTPAPTVTTDSSAAAPNLRGTDWRLVAVGDKPVADKPVTVTDSARAAHIILQTNSKQVAGSGGCNRLFGIYELNGDALRFSGVGSTRMACKNGMETETAFLPLLLRVKRWKITGRQLELSDSAGVILARFEERK
jgi:heat shock protein HslJ